MLCIHRLARSEAVRQERETDLAGLFFAGGIDVLICHAVDRRRQMTLLTLARK